MEDAMRIRTALFGLVALLCSVAVSAQSCAPPPDRAVAWWPGDGNADDIQGHHAGTAQNGLSFGPGVVRQAFRFDGIDDHVVVPDAPSLRAVDALSIEMWVNFARLPRNGSFGDGMTLIEKADDYLAIWRADLNLLQFTIADACDDLYHLGVDVPLPLLQAGEWHHFAFTSLNGGPGGFDLHVFVDGVEQPALRDSMHDQCGFFTGPTGDLHIGTRPLPPGFELLPFAGLIDEASIYDRVLTPSEIRAIYDAGSGGKCTNADRDGDGVPDSQDACPSSVLTASVAIDGCDSGAPNAVLPNGCSVADEVARCAAAASSHGQFVSCVARVGSDARRAGIMSGQQVGALQGCAARSKFP
jgi:Concanavalin A-like lectin/glucanases superfamily